MQDDQAIFIVWILSCVRHSRSGSDSLGFVFAEFKQAGADGLRLFGPGVPERGFQIQTVDGVNQGLRCIILTPCLHMGYLDQPEGWGKMICPRSEDFLSRLLFPPF